MKTLVVLGGGTAGWLTALLAKRSFPEHKIVVVESSKIGILGAGEGSTPHLIGLLDYLEIPVSDLVVNTSSTIKNGIMFDGWNNKKTKYLHSFEIFNNGLSRYVFNKDFSPFEWSEAPLLDYVLNYNELEPSRFDFATVASLKNKVLFKPKHQNGSVPNPILNFDAHSAFSLHFDARSLASYLSSVAQSRGIVRIEGEVKDVLMKDESVESLFLNDGIQINGDFFFDCTGFGRLLIGKKYESKWISFKDSLPAKRAMPFFLKNDVDNIEPYTTAKAMSKGWIWKIPLQHRHGCGYVYDPDVITDEEVKKEIDSFAGEEVTVPTVFNFEPGYFEEIWKGNVLAVGLANGFVEPLEATSILQSILLLQRFFNAKHKVFSRDQGHKDSFNSDTAKEHEDVAAFIYLHYMTNKTNNDFWKNFEDNYKKPKVLEEILPKLKTGILDSKDNLEIFSIINYLTVLNGNGVLNKDEVKDIYEHIIEPKISENDLLTLAASVDAFSETLVPHSSFLKYLGASFEKES